MINRAVTLALNVVAGPIAAAKSGVTAALGSTGGVAGAMEAAGGGVGKIATAMAGPAMAIAGAATSALAPIEAIIDSIGKMVGLANPALMERLGVAMDDVFAVVGQALMPVIEALIPVVEMLGDFIASILPDQKMMNDLMEAYKPALNSVKAILTVIAPILHMLANTYLKILAEVITLVATTIQKVIKFIAGMLADMMQIIPNAIPGAKETQERLLAIWRGDDVKFDRSSKGAAARGVSYVGVAELGRQAQLDAARQGRSYEEIVAENTTELVQWLRDAVMHNANNRAIEGASS